MARAEFDMSEFDRWAEIVQRAPAVAEREARAVLSRGALQIKKDARRMAPKGPRTPHYQSSINYDLIAEPGGLMAEIGPAEGRRQWGLGNLLEYGSAHNVPHPHLEPALDLEEPRFIRAAEALAAKAVGDG